MDGHAAQHGPARTPFRFHAPLPLATTTRTQTPPQPRRPVPGPAFRCRCTAALSSSMRANRTCASSLNANSVLRCCSRPCSRPLTSLSNAASLDTREVHVASVAEAARFTSSNSLGLRVNARNSCEASGKHGNAGPSGGKGGAGGRSPGSWADAAGGEKQCACREAG